MSRTTDQCTTIDANANEETNADTFASYVRASKKCPSCGRPMKLIKSKSGKFFLACAGYPACRKTLPVDIDMIEEYFYRNSKKRAALRTMRLLAGSQSGKIRCICAVLRSAKA